MDQLLDILFLKPVELSRASDDSAWDEYFIDLEEDEMLESIAYVFKSLKAIEIKYGVAPIDPGLWFLFAKIADYSLIDDFIKNPNNAKNAEAAEINFFKSTESIYVDYVQHYGEEPLPTSFYMLWDVLLSEVWSKAGFLETQVAEFNGYESLQIGGRKLIDLSYEILSRLLSIPDGRTQSCALHGLGHLHHPLVAQRIEQYISDPTSGAEDFEEEYLEQCRTGTCM